MGWFSNWYHGKEEFEEEEEEKPVEDAQELIDNADNNLCDEVKGNMDPVDVAFVEQDHHN